MRTVRRGVTLGWKRRSIAKEPRYIHERTFRFAVLVVRLCNHLGAKAGVQRMLVRQLLRGGTSIGANVEEAQAGQSRADFISRLSIALKEARETSYWLRLLDEADGASAPQLAELSSEVKELMKILGAIIVSAKKAGR